MSEIAHKLQQAQQLLDSGRYAQARDVLQRVIRHAPGDRNANVLLRHALSRLGQPQQALYYAQRALAAAPDDPDLIALNAMSLAECGKLAEATTVLEPCVARNTSHVLSRATLARLYGVQERLGDCLKTCLPALAAGEQDPRLLSIYASALLRIGRADEAVPIMKHVTLAQARSAGRSADPGQVSGLANAMLYDQNSRPADLFAAHYAFGRLVAAELPAPPPTFSQLFDPERRIRLGIVSPDMRNHPSQRFLLPLLEHLDRARVEVLAYSTADPEDQVTASFRALADRWCSAARLSIRELTERIRADKVDVLLDTAGHTQGNRLLAFQLRGAPVQATWLGYPATTGMSSMDYRIVDSITDPPGFESQSTEQLIRIDPCFAVYRPPAGAPEVEPVPPSARPGATGVTFVSYNAIQKLNSSVVALWGRILRENRFSRLLLRHRATLQADVREHLVQRLAEAGASREQVVVQPPAADSVATMAGYNDADIALDPFPYPGITTTCEALWMGVPVITLAGESSFSRQGLSTIHCAGLADCIASNPDEYAAIAARLAADAGRLANLRRTLRATLAASAFRDEPGYARRFEAAIRTMWRKRCEQQAGA